ncbi:MAG: L-threonylcarbamoyladenylate synthase [Desulfobulbus sp.]|nr:L-threonylcarbamoyladenylate synthase [Desulfobulbus sp.]
MSQNVVPSESTFQHAAAILRAGGVVAFPTETYYGLAVDPFNEKAVDRLYRIKQRSRKLPILLLVENAHQLPQVAKAIPALYRELIRHFWPGALSLVFPAQARCSLLLTGKTGTIAVRQSPHPVAHRLVTAFGAPVTATSANISGKPAAITAQQVVDFFADRVDLVVDGGITPGGQGSTLVGVQDGVLCCLRQGKIEFSLVQAVGTAYNQATNRL